MDLLLIGGVSGSGKSVAIAALEDSGYYAVSNLPLSLLPALLAQLKATAQDRVAIVLDVKTEPGLNGLSSAIEDARTKGWTIRFLYLDAKTDTLVKRFSETRRRHPFSSDDRTLTEAIEFERERLAEVRTLGYSFDTSDLSAAALRSWIKDFVSVDPSKVTLKSTPVVANGVMFVTSGPTMVAALDLRSGKALWEWTRPIAPSVLNLGFPRVNRGVAVLDNMVYVGTLDGALIFDLHSQKWTRLQAELPARTVLSISGDERFVYFGTTSGIARVARSYWERL